MKAKVGDLVRFKYTRPPNRWTNKAFLVSACTETRILLVGAHFWSPHGKSDKTQWHPREGWEVINESR